MGTREAVETFKRHVTNGCCKLDVTLNVRCTGSWSGLESGEACLDGGVVDPRSDGVEFVICWVVECKTPGTRYGHPSKVQRNDIARRDYDLRGFLDWRVRRDRRRSNQVVA